MQPDINSQRATTEIAELAVRLQAAGVSLSETADGKPLREVERFLWGWKNDNTDEHVRFLVFFLNMFIDKYFSNLTGDVPFIKNVTPPIQIAFCKKSGEALVRLAQHINENDIANSYQCYVRLGSAYIDAVDDLNEKFKKNSTMDMGDQSG